MFLKCGVRSCVLRLQAKEFVACFLSDQTRPTNLQSMLVPNFSGVLRRLEQSLALAADLCIGVGLRAHDFLLRRPRWPCMLMGVYAVCSPYRQVTRFKGYEAPKTPVSTGPSTQKRQCLHSEICIIYTPQFCVLSLMALDDSKGASRSARTWCVALH